MANKLKQRLDYIKNTNSYKRWLRKNYFYDYNDSGNKTIPKRWLEEGPEQYPCYVIRMCVSCNYEESEPFFIYGNELMDMALIVQRAVTLSLEGKADEQAN
ncbi:TPA: hypothetical protein ACQ39K_001994 [Yersinia enterocolitica]